MATDKGHLRDEELQDGLDRRLPPARMAELQGHIQGCERCRQTWDALAWTKQQASRAPAVSLPEGLRAEIAQALSREGTSASTRRRLSSGSRRLRSLAWAAGIVALLIAAAVFAPRTDPVAAVARDHAAVRSGRLTLALQTGDVKRMERYFAEAGLPFSARVFDLGMMRYQLEGGRVHAVRGRHSALLVYRGPDGDILVCQMYRGQLAELPDGAELHEKNGIRFLVYRRDGLTLVIWPEGDVICVLAGERGPEVVLPLAIAKASPTAR